MNPEYFKAIGGVFAGVATYVSNSIAQIVAPDQSWSVWLDKYGIPTFMLGISLYVVVVLYKALRDSQNARIADKESMLTQYRADFTAAQTTRLEMVAESRETKEALREFTAEMRAHQNK